MRVHDKHIILIGFKHVGKSLIGRSLALRLNRVHIDLDDQIEYLYKHQFPEKLNCREIVQRQGADFFRHLEHQALVQVIQNPPCIISVGGGTPMLEENRQLMQSHCIIHITASRKQVFHRIMHKGRPAFFPENEDAWTAFNRFWDEREKVYQSLATFSVNNQRSVAWTMEQLAGYFREDTVKNSNLSTDKHR